MSRPTDDELRSAPMTAQDPCPFCEIVAGRSPAEIVEDKPSTIAIVPLNPVTEGHLLVIPKKHVDDFGPDPYSSLAMRHAGELAAKQWCNVITSRGAVATQTVFHLHIHIVPRREKDRLKLPWTGQNRWRPRWPRKTKPR